MTAPAPILPSYDLSRAKVVERPILFSGEMIRAIQDGRKTQTRRVVSGAWHEADGYLQSEPGGEDGEWYFSCRHVPASFVTRCPYGEPGNRLWVKETFAVLQGVGVKYRADNPNARKPSEYLDTVWTPSIFMPHKWSRITLKIVSVRVERVTEIDGDGIRAEGVQLSGTKFDQSDCRNEESYQRLLRLRWIDLWDSINGKKHPWKSNPFVWIITFSKL